MRNLTLIGIAVLLALGGCQYGRYSDEARDKRRTTVPGERIPTRDINTIR